MTQGARGHRAGRSEDRRYNGERRVPLPRDDTGALGGVALAGLKTRHYNFRAWRAQRYGCAARGVRQWRPSTNVNEHKEERPVERLVDMEVSRKKD
jgi:hypothetical protein